MLVKVTVDFLIPDVRDGEHAHKIVEAKLSEHLYFNEKFMIVGMPVVIDERWK